MKFIIVFIVLLASSTYFQALGVNIDHKMLLRSSERRSLTGSSGGGGFQIDSARLSKSCISSLMQVIPPDFCWKKGGDAGLVPTACPSGFFRSLALCYELCRPGYKHILGICYQACPGSYTDHGLTCYKNLFHWFFKSSYIPFALTNFSPRIPCPSGMYRNGALCYKDCSIIGMANCGIGSCASSADTCASSIVNIAVETLQGVADGVMLIASAGTSAAGGAAAKSTLKTTASKIGPAAFKAAARNLKATLTGQFSKTIKTRAIAAAKSAGKSFVKFVGENVAQKSAETVIQTFCEPIVEDFVKRTVTSTISVEVDTIVSAVDIFNINGITDGCQDTSTDGGVKCARNVVQGLSVFDPTGVLTIAAAFMHPKCQDLTPVITQTDTAVVENAIADLSTVPDDCIQLYSECYYKGDSVTVCGNITTLAGFPFNFNDVTSSIKTGKSFSGLLFQHENFQGVAMPFKPSQGIACLDDYQSEELKMNEMVTSVGFGFDKAITLNYRRKQEQSPDANWNRFLWKSSSDDEIVLGDLEYLKIRMYYSDVQLSLYPEKNFGGTRLDFDQSTDVAISYLPFTTIRSYAITRYISIQKFQDGYYNIRNKNSNLVLDIQASRIDDGAPLLQYIKTWNENQIFYFQRSPNDGPGVFTIQAKHSGKYLDVEYASKDDGAKVSQYSSTGNRNQKWTLQANFDATITFLSLNSGKALDVFNGSKEPGTIVGQWTPHGGDNQKFFLDRA